MHLSAQSLDRAASRRHDNADQVRIRGGWSGGAPMRPSAIKLTSAKDSVRVRKETWIALVGDGLARAIVSMHIASSGQSWQLLFFCPSGQHGMSPDIAAIPLISPTGRRFAATGDPSGAATKPTITRTASKRPMSL